MHIGYLAIEIKLVKIKMREPFRINSNRDKSSNLKGVMKKRKFSSMIVVIKKIVPAIILMVKWYRNS